MANMVGQLEEHILLPVGDLLTGQRMIKRYHFLQKAQWWDRDKLLKQRNQLLASTIKTAYMEVPFYKELYENAGVNVEDIRTPRDLAGLPIITKDMIRPSYPAKMRRDTGQKTYEKCTSGSTGKNFFVMEDAQTAGWYRASFLLSLSWAGWSIGEPHFQTGMTLQRGFKKKLKDRILRCSYSSAFDLSDDVLDGYLDLIERKKLRHIWGYPGSIYYLAKRASEKGWKRQMKSVVTWGDTLDPAARNVIEATFRKKVNDTYGCGEGIQVAAQCGTGNHYHIHSLDVVVEIVDDEGSTVPPGMMGNILLTRLHPGPMPLIRYRVGDRGVLGSGECSCGRSFEILEAIRGRESDEIITPSGNKLIVHFFTGIFENFEFVSEFQVIQTAIDALNVKVVPNGMINQNHIEKIINELKIKGAADMAISVEIVETIPIHTTGKRRFVIKRIPTEKQ